MLNRELVEKIFSELAQIGKNDDGSITRLGYTENEDKAFNYIKQIAETMGCIVWSDTWGNMYISNKKILEEDLIVIGSHLDTVPNGGQFDGTFGVITGLAILSEIIKSQIELNHQIIVVAFRCEESSRFRKATIGSLLATTENFNLNDLKEITDINGINLTSVIDGSVDFLAYGNIWNENISLYFEPHIEQTRILYDSKKQIGIVTGISAPVRYIVTLAGREDHSGTPTKQRQEAMNALGVIIVKKENLAKQFDFMEVVATITNIIICDASMNKIPKQIQFYLDIRSHSSNFRNVFEEQLKFHFQEICKKRKIKIDFKETERKNPVQLPEKIYNVTKLVCENEKVTYQLLSSKAGYDAMNVADAGIPTAMLFIPSKEGRSHCKEEFSSIDDIMTGINITLKTIIKYSYCN